MSERSRPNLRQKSRVCYYEPEEPNFDEYTYCDGCSDFVYEYCSIHGPLLVVPDDKVPSKSTYPSYIPRAALTIPRVFLHLAPTIIPGAGLGVFSTLTLPRGVRFGPYCGKRTQDADSMYCWQIYDNNNKPSHVVDAVDGDRSNWMRYVNCARHWKEQNLLAYQYQGQLYYRTIKIVPRFTELMVFYGSEFANALHVNLSKYNSPLEYPRTLGTTRVYESKIKENNAVDIFETLHDNINIRNDEIDEYTKNTIDPFEFIEKQYDGNQNEQNNVISSDSQTIPNDKIGNGFDVNSSIEVNFFGDNININFNNTNDEENMFKCHICNKIFGKPKNLRRHIKRHYYKYNCELCNYKSKSENCFREHVENHTKVFEYNCNLCFYKTNIKGYFNRHCRIHQITKNTSINNSDNVTKNAIRQCQICDFNTSSCRRFSIHISQHRGNIYKCDQCDYSNHAKYNLNRHIAKHH